jgi:hypothetical protein
MINKNVLAIAFAVVTGASMSVAYADYDHRGDRDYRDDHRDNRDYHRDQRDRHERERHDQYARHEYRGPSGYTVARPVYVSPQVVYASPMPSSLNIVVPITLP